MLLARMQRYRKSDCERDTSTVVPLTAYGHCNLPSTVIRAWHGSFPALTDLECSSIKLRNSTPKMELTIKTQPYQSS